ncbi:MAG: ABC transporter ATP-binding protein [Pseudomonadota bacterium]
MSTLELRNLSKAFGGVRALAGVSFSLSGGELLALIGPNGAGKSTCFNLIGGQLRPDAGEIFFDGKPIHGLAPRRLFHLGIGRTFQVAAAFGSLSVRENIEVALRSRQGRSFSLFQAGNPDRTKELLERVGLLEQAQRPCALLAYGDLKRVELALALAGRPRLLLMDEPTAGMASEERGELMRLVGSLARGEGIAVLFTEHDMDVVFGHADRVLVLSEGALIAQGTPAAVRADARVRRVYLGDELADA